MRTWMVGALLVGGCMGGGGAPPGSNPAPDFAATADEDAALEADAAAGGFDAGSDAGAGRDDAALDGGAGRDAANAGRLDNSFSDGGVVITPFSAIPSGVAVQPDGKIVVSAYEGYDGSHFIVMRFLPDGTPDKDFATDGQFTKHLYSPIGYDAAYGLALQPDGRIVVAGCYSVPQSDERVATVVRLAANGALDDSFTNVGLTYAEARAVGLQPDGKIVAVGGDSYLHNPSAETGIWVARWDDQGLFDKSFGTDGVTHTDVKITVHPDSLALASDGKIVVAGSSGGYNNQTGGVVVARYDDKGVLDTSFARLGWTRTPFDVWRQPTFVALLPDGSPIVAGTVDAIAFPGYFEKIGVARFTPTGALDSSFAGGSVIVDYGSRVSSAGALVLEPSGAAVVAGDSDPGASARIGLLRLDGSGRLDPTFGSGGRVITSSSGNLYATAAVLASDGTLVVAGQADGYVMLARYR